MIDSMVPNKAPYRLLHAVECRTTSARCPELVMQLTACVMCCSKEKARKDIKD